MTILAQNPAGVKSRTERRDGRDYARTSRLCDRVLVRGRRVVTRCTEIEGERFAATLTARTDTDGRDWHAVNFVSCARPDKDRRTLVEPSGRVWLLLGDDLAAVSSRNKYARYTDRLIREMASRAVEGRR